MSSLGDVDVAGVVSSLEVSVGESVVDLPSVFSTIREAPEVISLVGFFSSFDKVVSDPFLGVVGALDDWSGMVGGIEGVDSSLALPFSVFGGMFGAVPS